jgi:hypothetical protein
MKLDEIFQAILEDADENDISPFEPSEEAIRWFVQKIDQLDFRSEIEGRGLVYSETSRAVEFPQWGKMYLFRYIPEYKDRLPIWDEFPLVIPRLRKKFLEQLLMFRNNDAFNDSTAVQLTYKELKSFSRLKHFKPTFKRYKINRVASKFIEIQPTEWMMAPFLPLEEFHKQNSSLWSKLVRKLRRVF